MTRAALIFVAVLAGTAAAAESVVPRGDRMDEGSARLLYAQILSYRKETWPQAIEQYERILRSRPLDPGAVGPLARLLLSAGRPEEAKALLDQAAAARFLTGEETLAAADVAFAAGRMADAAGLYRRALSSRPGDADAGRGLVLALSLSGSPEAGPALNTWLRSHGDDFEVAHLGYEGLARASGPGAAAEAARQGSQSHPGDPRWKREWADFEAQRGHAVLARRLFLEANQSGDTPEARLRLGRAALSWGDFYAAGRALREALAARPGDSGLRDDIGRLLMSSDRLEEAEGWYRGWLTESPDERLALASLAELERKERRVRTDSNQNAAEAARTAPRKPVRISVPPSGASAGACVELAGHYAAAGDFASAVACLQAARAADPDYYPAWSELAEFLAIAGRFDEALAEFAQLKQAMPENRQVLLGEARALAWSRRYEASLRAYAHLAELDPTDPVPRLEAARTAGWAKLRSRSADRYATAWREGPVDRQLAAALAALPLVGGGLAAQWRSWAEHPDFPSEPFAAAERFAADLPALGAALPADSRLRLESAWFALEPSFLLQREWWLENAAKEQAWERRFTTAESTYRRLLAIEPGNEEAWFDLSQVQAAQGLGRRERATLAHLLAIDPSHSIAGPALARREVLSQPWADAEGRYWRERGRGDLSSMERTAAEVDADAPLGDQGNLRAEGLAGYESPLTRPANFAYRGAGASIDEVVAPGWSGSAGFLHQEFYDRRIGHEDTGQAQLGWAHDADSVAVGWTRQYEVANEFALFQGTRSDNLWISGAAALSRQLGIDGRFTSTQYNDGNHGVAAVLRPAYAWTDHPSIFKTTLTLEYRDTRDDTIYFRDSAGRLTNLIHPYWTPQGYTHVALTLEWYRDLAREFFAGAQEHVLDLRVTFGTDSESNPGATFEAEWHREWRDRWILFASAYENASRLWNATGLRLRLSRRF